MPSSSNEGLQENEEVPRRVFSTSSMNQVYRNSVVLLSTSAADTRKVIGSFSWMVISSSGSGTMPPGTR